MKTILKKEKKTNGSSKVPVSAELRRVGIREEGRLGLGRFETLWNLSEW